MTVSRSDFAGTGRGPRKPQPVRGEPQVSPGAPEHLESNAAAAEGYARAAFGMVDNADCCGGGTMDGHAPWCRGNMRARIAKDDRVYTVASVTFGVMLATAVSAVAIAAFLRTKPVALDPMPIPRYMTIDCWPMYGARRTVEIDTKKTDSDKACKH